MYENILLVFSGELKCDVASLFFPLLLFESPWALLYMSKTGCVLTTKQKKPTENKSSKSKSFFKYKRSHWSNSIVILPFIFTMKFDWLCLFRGWLLVEIRVKRERKKAKSNHFPTTHMTCTTPDGISYPFNTNSFSFPSMTCCFQF